MKNKILASLLAVCLFAGLAVPAFAVSSQSGSFDEVTKAEFRKTSYDIKNGTSDEDMKAELMAFASTKQLVQDPEIEWSVENDGKYAFGVSDGKVTCSEDSGTATLVAKITGAKGVVVTATTKLNATKKDAERPIANGFTFKNNTNTLLTGVESFLNADAKGNTITIVPTPSNAYFTPAQVAYMDSVVLQQLKLDVKKADGTTTVTLAANVGAYNADDREYVIDFDTAVTAAVPAAKGKEVYKVTGTGDLSAAVASFTGATMAAGFLTASETTETAANKIAAAINAVAPSNFTATVSKSGSDILLTVEQKVGNDTANPTLTVTTPGTGTLAVAADSTKAVVGKTGVPAVATAGLATIDTAKSAAQSVTVKAPAFPTPTSNNSANTNNVERRVSIATAAAKQATTMNAAGTVTIEVGERIDVAKNFKQGPSNANVTHDVTYSLEYADTSAQYNDFADIVKQKTSECIVEGVAVGTNKIRATSSNGKEAVITVKVVEKGTKPAAGGTTTVLSAWTPKLGVGETANVVVKADKAVTYTSLDTAIVTVDAAGKLTAVKEGTAKVKVQEEGKDAVYLTVTVAAATTKPSDKPSDVPQTAVVALAPLF